MEGGGRSIIFSIIIIINEHFLFVYIVNQKQTKISRIYKIFKIRILLEANFWKLERP